MENFKNDRKILFIPGWLDSGKLHGYKYSLDIWHKRIDINKNWEANLIIAHSLGALVALANWHIYGNFKIILINPVFSRKKIFSRWFKSMIFQGTPCPPKRLLLFFSFIPAYFKAIKLFKVPAIDIIKNMPQDQLIIIYGEKDKYLYDKEIVNDLSSKGFRVIGVKTSGHNYDSDIEEAIRKSTI